MKRYKRLYVVLAVLLAACIATFALSRYKAQKEQIQTSGETILSISADEVESLSWDYDGQTLSFHRDGAWSYDDDAAFPVDAEQMNLLLEPFAAFGAAFIIEDVDDLGQYGLDNPVCTIRITAGGETHTIQLGDYSKMDAQRYVSIGDGNVYLAAHDPLDEFDVTLDELIDQDDIPAFGQVSELRFSGAENYAVSYQEDGGNTYREDDVYFTERDGAQVPLDPDRVEDYLQAIQSLSLTDCVTYSANDDDLQSCGLDSPELTIEVAYDGEDGASGTFTLNVSRDPDERAAEAPADGESEEEVTAYARVGQSKLLYQITGAEYEALMAASYDALRHQEVLPAALEDISQVDMTLERISEAENGQVALVFSSRTDLADTTLLRVQTVDIITEELEGIRIPRRALRVFTETQTDEETGETTEEQYTAVFTVVGTQAELQRVNVLYTDENFYLVEPADPDASRRLREGDEVILNTSGIYDGKVIR